MYDCSLIQAKRRDNNRDSSSSISNDMTCASELTDFQLPLKEEVETLQSTSIGALFLQAMKTVSELHDQMEGTKVLYANVLEYFGEVSSTGNNKNANTTMEANQQHSQRQPDELFSIIVTQ